MPTPTLGPWNQVVALTQQMINTGLAGLYKSSKTATDTVRRVGNREAWLENIVFGIPEVIIPHNPDSYNRTKVLFCMYLKSGTFNYYTSDDAPTPSKISAADWCFAIPADLELNDITDPEVLKQKRAEFNVGTDYSVGRLLIAFESVLAADLDKKYTKIPKEVSDRTMTVLKSMILKSDNSQPDNPKPSAFLLEMQTLGYVLKPWVTSGHLPTFIPISTSFETSSWYDTTQDNQKVAAGTGTEGNSILNYLLYKQMTRNPDNSEPQEPDISKAWLKTKENWTPGRADLTKDDAGLTLGRIYISKERFFDGWLVPRMNTVLEAMHFTVYGMYLGAWADSSYKWDCQVQLRGIRDNESKPALEQDGDHWSFKERTVKAEYPWQKGGPATISIEGGAEAKNSATLEYQGNVLTLKGTSTLWFYAKVWRGVKDTGGTMNKVDRISRKFSWSIELLLESVSDGGLSFKKKSTSSEWSDVESAYELYYLNGFMDNLDKLGKNLGAQLDNVEGLLADDLKGTHKFWFPAGGLFSFNNPTINEHGDVMADISYHLPDDKIPGSERAVKSAIDHTPINVDFQGDRKGF